MSVVPDTIDLSGLRPLSEFEAPAILTRQGGRPHLTFQVPYNAVTRISLVPDPGKPFPGNRKVDKGRAQKFAKYLRTNPEAIVPSITLRVDEGIFDWSEEKATLPDGSKLVIVRSPYAVQAPVIDGQHRVLGYDIANTDTLSELTKARTAEAKAVAKGDTGAAEAARKKLKAEEAILKRLRTEMVTIELVVCDEEAAKQLFVDINANTKGVNPDLNATFDHRFVEHLISQDLLEHAVLKDRVELGIEGRMSQKGERNKDHIMGAKHVVDIVHALCVGRGRIGENKRRDLEKNREQVTASAITFLNALAGTRTFRRLMIGEVDAIDLRTPGTVEAPNPNASLLGSATMLRVLAVVWYLLTSSPPDGQGWSRADAGAFIRYLEEQSAMSVPVNPDHKLWDSGEFLPGAVAPQARHGSIGSLADFIVNRYATGWGETNRSTVTHEVTVGVLELDAPPVFRQDPS